MKSLSENLPSLVCHTCALEEQRSSSRTSSLESARHPSSPIPDHTKVSNNILKQALILIFKLNHRVLISLSCLSFSLLSACICVNQRLMTNRHFDIRTTMISLQFGNRRARKNWPVILSEYRRLLFFDDGLVQLFMSRKCKMQKK